MLALTHMAFGFFAAVIWAKIFPVKFFLPFAGIVMLASLLPDIDHEGSTINRAFPVTRLPARFLTHRGFFHSVFPPLMIYGGFIYFDLPFFAVAVSLGYAAHLVSDSITKSGINFLHPIATFHVKGPVKTGGLIEFLIFILVVGASYGLL